ncbi:hypothetical protein [Sphingomonas agri]|uniref:hypothetical protein n=1 Tax=Sphingomonas agri TaxID=1813878 RepID=UPI00311DDEBC
MFRAIAALALASASAQPTSTLTSTIPWWERVTVTVGDDGETHSCRYESSLRPQNAQDCSVASAQASMSKTASSSGGKDQVTRITFERRFSPGEKPDGASLQPGETLLGSSVMALAIDGQGAVKGCKVVSTAGSLPPQYGCNEASSERFEASVSTARVPAAARAGFMTVLVYGHSEHVV